MGQTDFNRTKCESLTQKQHDVLRLVVERKSSKEIARILGISKPTVDQRIANARQTLGARNRDEAALMFAHGSKTYDRVIYDTACVPIAAIHVDMQVQETRQSSGLVLEEAAIPFSGFVEYPSSEVPRLPWRISGNISIASRLLIIVGLSVGILATILIGLAVAQSLSGLLTAP